VCTYIPPASSSCNYSSIMQHAVQEIDACYWWLSRYCTLVCECVCARTHASEQAIEWGLCMSLLRTGHCSMLAPISSETRVLNALFIIEGAPQGAISSIAHGFRHIINFTIYKQYYKILSYIHHTALQAGRSQIQFLMVSWIFHWQNPFGCTMALGSTLPLIEMSTRNISWGVKAVGA
jgi:hypothetical protein